MSSVLPGLEILHHQVSSSLRSKEDALVSVIHWILISDGMKCHGIGDEWPSNEDNVSELLPQNWNSNQEVYLLRYRNKSRLGSFLLKVIKVGPSILINLVNMEKEKAGGILVKTDDYVTDSFKDFKSAFKDIDKLIDSFKEEVMHEVNKPTTAASTSDEKKSDEKVNKSKSKLENEDPLRVPGTERRPLTDWITDRDPFGVGRGDLDPFGGGVGGGMLMDPSRFRTPGGPFGPPPISSGFPGRLPRCAVPPGARFDHYGPAAPDPDRFSRPDPDNLPPPGYEDMFF